MLRLGFLRKGSLQADEFLASVVGQAIEDGFGGTLPIEDNRQRLQTLEFAASHGKKYLHTCGQFSDGLYATSLPRGGVQFLKELRRPEDYDWLETDLSEDQEALVRVWWRDHEGDRYDWKGFLGLDGDPNFDRYYCTEGWVFSLQATALFLDLVAWRTHADALRAAALERWPQEVECKA